MIVDFLALIGIARSAGNGIGVGTGSAGDEVSDAAVLVALVVVDVSGEDDEAGGGVGLAGFEHFCEIHFLHAGFVAFAEHAGIGTGVGRMVEHEEDEIDAGGKVVELVGEPLALRAGELVERAVEDEDERVGGADGIVAALVEIGEMVEVVGERGLFVAVEFVVADGGEDRIRSNAVYFSSGGLGTLFARIDNCSAKVLFETATGRFF